LAIDGDQKTRWAAPGNQWIQFGMMPDTEMDHIEINWFEAGRLENFDIQVSDDAKTWKTIDTAKTTETKTAITDQIDIYKLTGGRNRAIALHYPVTLPKPGNISVKLVAVKGKAIICGTILERIEDK